MTAPQGPLERDNLPYEAWLVEPGLQTALLHGDQDQRWLMQENAELHLNHAEHEVDKRHTTAVPPAAVGEANDQHACGALGRCAGQLGHVRIAADDAAHDDDIGGFNLGPRLGEVHDPASPATFFSLKICR